MAEELEEVHSDGSLQQIKTVAQQYSEIYGQIFEDKIPSKPGDIEGGSKLQITSKSGRFNSTKLIARNDVDGVKTRSLDTDLYSVERNQVLETWTENNKLPVELMEKIICYLDGRTLLLFSSLSRECDAIVERAVRYKKLWKKICEEEIPRRHFIKLYSKHLHMCVPLDSISEAQHKKLYQHWLQWQNSLIQFSSTRLTEPLCTVFDVINSMVKRHKMNFLRVSEDKNYVCLCLFIRNDRKYAMYSSDYRHEQRRFKTFNGHGIALNIVGRSFPTLDQNASEVYKKYSDGSGSGSESKNLKKLYTISELTEMASNSMYSTKFPNDRHPSVDPKVLLGGYHCRVIYIGIKLSSRNAIDKP